MPPLSPDGSVEEDELVAQLGIPAAPKSMAYRDHPSAARVPIEMRVSMVAVALRALSAAARWKGHPAHSTTGAVSAREAQAQ